MAHAGGDGGWDGGDSFGNDYVWSYDLHKEQNKAGIIKLKGAKATVIIKSVFK